MVKNASRNSKSQVSGHGDGSRASLDKLEWNSRRNNPSKPCPHDVELMGVTTWILESSLTVIWNHQLIVQWPPKKESTKCCESSGGILWEGQVLFCHFTSPWHLPILYAILVLGWSQQLGKGNWYHNGIELLPLHKEKVRGFRLSSSRRKKLKRVYCFKV